VQCGATSVIVHASDPSQTESKPGDAANSAAPASPSKPLHCVNLWAIIIFV